MSEPTAKPDFPSVIDLLIATRLEGVHVSMPARVVAYDKRDQRASVLPLIQRVYTDVDGERQTETYPVIDSVPVQHPGGGKFRVALPIAVGDTVWLHVASQSLDRFLALGAPAGAIDPADGRRFHLSDVVSVTGIRDFAHALQNAPDDHGSIGYDDVGAATVEFYPDEVRLGGDAATAPVQTTLDGAAFMTKLNAAIAAMGADPAVSALTALKAALAAAPAWPVGAGKVKAL